MAWYYILFFAALIFFIIKFFLTIIAGDVDFDVDVDGDVDFDLSSMFSFKGVLHFVLGFSSYLSIVARLNTTNNETYVFDIPQYILGVTVGLIFVVGLFYLYKAMMQFNHYNSENINLSGYKGTILIKNGLIDVKNKEGKGHTHLYSYTVLVNTEFGSQKVNVLSESSNHEVGTEHPIYKNVQGTYFI